VKAARWTPHETGKSKCTLINNAVKKWGKSNFSWFVMEIVDVSELNARECHWVAALNSMKPNGYNLKTAGDVVKHDQQSIEKMKVTRNTPMYVAALKKRRQAEWEENKDRFVAAMTLGKQSDEARLNMSVAQTSVWQRKSKRELDDFVDAHRKAAASKRERELDSCTTTEEVHATKKRFARMDKQLVYKAKVKSGELVPTRRKNTDSKRNARLKACKTEEERMKLEKYFARIDYHRFGKLTPKAAAASTVDTVAELAVETSVASPPKQFKSIIDSYFDSSGDSDCE
jgi:hypothetical protein